MTITELMSIDLNCDLGEGMTTDAAIMPYISSANIACGLHAGDDDTMRRTIELCVNHGVAIGAHPGFRDRENFGRVPMSLEDSALYDLLIEQLHILQKHSNELGARLHHIKAHGALYNMAAKDARMSRILAQVTKDFNASLIVYALSGSITITEARALGLTTASEVFADRTYQPDGTLTPRTEKNAIIKNTQESLAQVMMMVKDRKAKAIDGHDINLIVDTICLHGDGTHAVSFAEAIHSFLKDNLISILPPHLD